MIKIINGILSVLKMLLLLVSFVLSLFIIIRMYQRLEKNIVDSISCFIPFVLLFILLAVNFVLKQKSVNQCLFYNVACCMVFIMIIVAAGRTFFDDHMVAYVRLGYHMNFNYFADIIAPMKSMLYILCVSNILLMIEGMDFSKLKKNKEVEEKPLKKKPAIELKPVK